MRNNLQTLIKEEVTKEMSKLHTEAIDFNSAVKEIMQALSKKTNVMMGKGVGGELIGKKWKIDQGTSSQPLMFSTSNPKITFADLKRLQAALYKKDWDTFAELMGKMKEKGIVENVQADTLMDWAEGISKEYFKSKASIVVKSTNVVQFIFKDEEDAGKMFNKLPLALRKQAEFDYDKNMIVIQEK